MKHFIFVYCLLVICLLSNAHGQIVKTDTSDTKHSLSEYEKMDCALQIEDCRT